MFRLFMMFLVNKEDTKLKTYHNMDIVLRETNNDNLIENSDEMENAVDL